MNTEPNVRSIEEGEKQPLTSVLSLVGLVFPLNSNSFKERGHMTKPLCDPDLSGIRPEPRRNRNFIQNTQVTQHLSLLANMSDDCFFTNDGLGLGLLALLSM